MSDKSEAFEKRAAAVTEKLLRSRESIVCIDSHTGGE
ncbi:MAG: hypothetical protein JRH07_19655, partial [Deltaproteobacteria bacterium]|nr:hypothetical protein [Deltaproteobacteria bacterium]